MLLFKPEHVALILGGRKTQTRRLWPKGARVKVGSIHQCRTRMLDKSSTFTRVEVLRVWQERLLDISGNDARAEGYGGRVGYVEAFNRINKTNAHYDNPLVWAVAFRLAP